MKYFEIVNCRLWKKGIVKFGKIKIQDMKKLVILSIVCVLMTNLSFALNPSRTYKQRPDKYNMEYQEVKVKTEDGAELNAWYFPTEKKNAELVLISHNGEGNMADYLRRVDQFRSNYNVVIYDYRGFGESSEFEIDNNMYIYPHFQSDFLAMVDYCRAKYTSQFHLYGWGIGAGLSLGIGYHRQEVKKIIADTPFFSMEDLENKFGSWDEPMEVPFAGYDKKYEPIYALDEAPNSRLQGILLIIGSNDPLYSPDDMKSLQQKQKKLIEKDVLVVEGSDGKDNFKKNKAAYFKRISEFLES